MRRLFALILITALWFGFIATPPAQASHLVPCRDSAAFAQRAKTSVSATAQHRFDFYASQNLLCGDDGLPHLIPDIGRGYENQFVIPGLIFLYIAGWIGWVGRSYLQAIKKGDSPETKEIIIDVPLAVKCSLSGFAWPLAAVGELTSGKLTAADNEIPISPR
jgi:photosystem I subunit 3